MTYRVCKSFEIEHGHMLMKHPSRCRYPHGHSRRVDVVLASESLDEFDMVCDFKAIKLVLGGFLDRWDHALAVNSADPIRESLGDAGERVVVFEGQDPTTEVLAKCVFDHLGACLASGEALTDEDGSSYRFPDGVRLERVRVTETSSSWAEYGVS